MNKRFLAIIVAAMLALGVLGLAACSGGSSSGSGGSSKSSASQKSPEEAVIGDWELAAAEYQNCLLSGDLSTIIGGNMELTFDKDGKASISLGSQNESCEWEIDKNTVTLVEGKNEIEIEYNSKDGTLTLDMGQIQSGFKGMTIIFVNDDSTYEAPSYNLKSAEPFTSLKDVEGKWSLSGAVMQGVSMTGDVKNAVGSDFIIEIKSDGTGSITDGGSNSKSVTFDASSKGVFMNVNGVSLELLDLDGDIAIDFTPAGISGVLIFS